MSLSNFNKLTKELLKSASAESAVQTSKKIAITKITENEIYNISYILNILSEAPDL